MIQFHLSIPWHTASFWNIIIQRTSHDYLTEKLVLAKPPQMEAAFFVKSQSAVLHFCHLTSFAKETKETIFSVKSSWEAN